MSAQRNSQRSLILEGDFFFCVSSPLGACNPRVCVNDKALNRVYSAKSGHHNETVLYCFYFTKNT